MRLRNDSAEMPSEVHEVKNSEVRETVSARFDPRSNRCGREASRWLAKAIPASMWL